MIKYLIFQLLTVSYLVLCFFVHQDYMRVKEAHEEEIRKIKAHINYLDRQLEKFKCEHPIIDDDLSIWENEYYKSYRNI